MTKRKGIRLLAALALCFTLCISFTVPAFAYADDTEQELPVTEATQPEATPETAAPEEPEPYEGEPIDGEGNAYTRDLLYDKATNKQFITVQTKTGNTFYVVIDYDAPINEEEEQYQTYFLNMVDEADLLALLDEETASSLTTCNCDTRCEAGAVNTECPVCKTNMSECTGAVPEPEEPVEGEETEVPEEPENASPNIALIIGIIALVGIGGGAYYYFKFVRGKKQKDEDLDFFDDEGYEEEPYINEDEEPVIADDEDNGDETKETEETTTSYLGALVILWGLRTQAPMMSALPNGGTAISPSSRMNGCLKSRRTSRSSSKCCATSCSISV